MTAPGASWLAPLRAALDARPTPLRVFCRDDDAGWRDDRLFALIELFRSRALPIDLAVIPGALTEELARTLAERARSAPAVVGLHQHGYTHANHETAGRKCEFGPSRPRSTQLADIAAGQLRLAELLGGLAQPIFTPPWNRCTEATGAALRDLGFRVLSRDDTAAPLGLAGLAELPIHVNWLTGRRGVPVGCNDMGHVLADAAARRDTLGVMFHHAVMDDAAMRAAAELLDLLAAHPSVRCAPMMRVATEAS